MTNKLKILKEFWEKLDDSPFVMLGIPSQAAHSMPMNAVFDDDIPNTLFFYTSRDNRAFQALPQDNKAMVQFSSKGHDFFACLSGTLSATTDPALIDKFWSNPVEAWYENGKKDPNLVMLRLDLEDAEMWRSDMDVIGMFKLLTGSTIDQEKAEEDHLETTM